MNEEKKAIGNLKIIAEYIGENYFFGKQGIENLKKDINVTLNYLNHLQKELDKKDKILDLIINMILSYDIDEDICRQIGKLNCDKYKDGECEKCLKDYFYKKAEVENE